MPDMSKTTAIANATALLDDLLARVKDAAPSIRAAHDVAHPDTDPDFYAASDSLFYAVHGLDSAR